MTARILMLVVAIAAGLMIFAACTTEEDTPEPSATEAPAPVEEEAMSRLAMVQERGTLICAINTVLPGFGALDANGNNVGFDIDQCRAVAAAVLGNANAVEYRQTTAAQRGPTMQSGEVDLMVRNTTWTSSRDATWGNFAQTTFYDGQGFMVPASLGINDPQELDGSTICVLQGTTTELNLQDFIDQNGLDIEVLTFNEQPPLTEAYLAGQCQAETTDKSGLVSLRTTFENPDDHVILAATISEEPLGPVVPHGDDQWYDIVKSVIAILIYAEAFGIDSGSVPTAPTGNTSVDRLFGLGDTNWGQSDLGLHQNVGVAVIQQVGNYGQIYDRHLTPLGVTREGSRNALWLNGGEIYAAPLR